MLGIGARKRSSSLFSDDSSVEEASPPSKRSKKDNIRRMKGTLKNVLVN